MKFSPMNAPLAGLLGCALFLLAGCGPNPPDKNTGPASAPPPTPPNAGPSLQPVASSAYQWTGLAISREGRVFVNFPRWSDTVPVSVGELVNGQVRPFPDAEWQNYREDTNHFICVQSVVFDDKNRLWVLDPASPKMQGITRRGPRLYHFDPAGNRMVRQYAFPASLLDPKKSYLNDVRVDTEREIAYITDSGAGGIFVVDLKSGNVQRRLFGHPSVVAEVDSLNLEDGSVFARKIHSDGIALSPDRNHLYYMALSGHTLYRVPTAALRDRAAKPEDQVEKLASVKAADGLLFGNDGKIYMAGLEDFSVYTYDPSSKEYRQLIRDAKIQWADSFAKNAGGDIFFTTSQLHLPKQRHGPYYVYQIRR